MPKFAFVTPLLGAISAYPVMAPSLIAESRQAHINQTHAGARIPKEEYLRMVKGDCKAEGEA